jgi:hypothetical protein
MVARSGVVFPASMVDILTNPMEIHFGLHGDLNHTGGGDLPDGLHEGSSDACRRNQF